MTPTRKTPAAVLLLALLAGSAVAQQPRSCAVSALDGEARYWVDGVWRPVEIASEIAIEGKVETGPDGRLEITCNDGTIVTIGVATEVNVSDLAGPERNVVLQLIAGIVGIVSPDGGWDRFEVRTPVAIASVRSTEWLVETSAEGGTAIFVRAGRLAVALSDGKRVSLGQGEGITVSAAGEAGPVKTWGAARIEQSATALGLGWR